MKVEFTFDKAKVQQRGYTLEAVYHTIKNSRIFLSRTR